MMELGQLIDQIRSLDAKAMSAARARQDRLTKPPGSLGRLEALSVQLAGMMGTERPQIRDKAVVVMAGDHGVTAEGISAYPAEVTPQMVMNFLHGGAAINALAKTAGARVVVVDMGVAAEMPSHTGLVSCKIGLGTANIARGPAMSGEQALQAVLAGAAVVQEEWSKGLDIVALGDMGIGNTTPSAAVACAILRAEPEAIVGRGTGVDDEGLLRKRRVVRQALDVNQPDPEDGLDVLARVGGFEISGLVGAIIAAAGHRIPVVLDGFITTAAALIAVQIAPGVRPYLIASHCSEEEGHSRMLDYLNLQPLFNYSLRLGEGSGAALALPVIEAAARVLDEMATFAEAGVSEQ
jgi:nicotinate-nucleotide--dimethylbenzimidazole phosphoribosyltransferase